MLCRPNTPRFMTLGKLAGYLKWVGRVGVVQTDYSKICDIG